MRQTRTVKLGRKPSRGVTGEHAGSLTPREVTRLRRLFRRAYEKAKRA